MEIGRSKSAELVVHNESVSGLHARLERRGDAYWIVDLNSANGTYVNGSRISEGELHENDEVRFGTATFTFKYSIFVRTAVNEQQPAFIPNLAAEAKKTSGTRSALVPSTVVAILLIAATGAFLTRDDKTMSTSDIARATVLVVISDSKDELCAFGSGFFAFDGKTIVTNHHVIESVVSDVDGEEDCKKIKILISDSTGLRPDTGTEASVTMFDEKADLALLKVDFEDDLDIRPLEPKKKAEGLGTEVRIYGYPGIGGVSLTVTPGILSGLDETDLVPLFKTDAQIASGNSGGPVVNKNGQLIGVAVASIIEDIECEGDSCYSGASIGLIIPISNLLKLIEK